MVPVPYREQLYPEFCTHQGRMDADFTFAGDLNVVFNAGHFMARRSTWTEKFLSDAFRIYPWPEWEDNGAMMILLGGLIWQTRRGSYSPTGLVSPFQSTFLVALKRRDFYKTLAFAI